MFTPGPREKAVPTAVTTPLLNIKFVKRETYKIIKKPGGKRERMIARSSDFFS